MPAARTVACRYAVALAAVGVALLLRCLMWPLLGPEVPFLFLWPAVVVAAWHGGLGPGLLVTVVSALAEDYFLIQPGALWNGTPAEVFGIGLFGLLGSLLSLLIDRLRRARRRVEQHAAALAEADRRKDDFLAMLGHELRNPLAPIRTAVRLLLADAGEERRRWAAGVIDRQAAQLARLLDDLLDVSRISRGKVRLRRQRVDLTDVL